MKLVEHTAIISPYPGFRSFFSVFGSCVINTNKHVEAMHTWVCTSTLQITSLRPLENALTFPRIIFLKEFQSGQNRGLIPFLYPDGFICFGFYFKNTYYS